MSVTVTTSANGRMQRKSLANQLDRLDSILDGLDGALSDAITDAVKDAVSTAVAETVRATLLEIVSNPQVLSLLRGVVPTAPPPKVEPPKPADEPKLHARVREGLSSGWQRLLAKLHGIGQAVSSRAGKIRDGVVNTVPQANAVSALKRPIFISLLVGFAVGIVAYASSPWVAGVVSGLAAMGAALGTQLAMFARRFFAGFSMS